jgi:hypothetical protein
MPGLVDLPSQPLALGRGSLGWSLPGKTRSACDITDLDGVSAGGAFGVVERGSGSGVVVGGGGGVVVVEH